MREGHGHLFAWDMVLAFGPCILVPTRQELPIPLSTVGNGSMRFMLMRYTTGLGMHGGIYGCMSSGVIHYTNHLNL